MILGIGLDLCQIERISKTIRNEHFLERIYTPAEQERIRNASDVRRGEIAAGLFAGKEAVSKALGTGFSGFGFSHIEIMPDKNGKPLCRLEGGAEEIFHRLGGESIFISITHESGMAAATAIIEGGIAK